MQIVKKKKIDSRDSMVNISIDAVQLHMTWYAQGENQIRSCLIRS